MRKEYVAGGCTVLAAIIGIFTYNLNGISSVCQDGEVQLQSTQEIIGISESIDPNIVKELEKKISEIDEKYEKLNKEFIDLSEAYQVLTSEKESLGYENERLQEEKNALNQQKESLEQVTQQKENETSATVTNSEVPGNTIYVSELTPFSGDLKFYDKYSMTDNLEKEHKHVFTSGGSLREYVFKINGGYRTISGTLFQNFETRSQEHTSKLKISGDGAIIFEASVSAGVEPIHFSEDISGINELTVRFLSSNSGNNARAGIADFVLSK